MNLLWTSIAWSEYVDWQNTDKKMAKKINEIIKDIMRNGNDGIGKPEPLKNMEGFWSRRIDKKNRVVYRIVGNQVEIAQCGTHYRD